MQNLNKQKKVQFVKYYNSAVHCVISKLYNKRKKGNKMGHNILKTN